MLDGSVTQPPSPHPAEHVQPWLKDLIFPVQVLKPKPLNPLSCFATGVQNILHPRRQRARLLCWGGSRAAAGDSEEQTWAVAEHSLLHDLSLSSVENTLRKGKRAGCLWWDSNQGQFFISGICSPLSPPALQFSPGMHHSAELPSWEAAAAHRPPGARRVPGCLWYLFIQEKSGRLRGKFFQTSFAGPLSDDKITKLWCLS